MRGRDERRNETKKARKKKAHRSAIYGPFVSVAVCLDRSRLDRTGDRTPERRDELVFFRRPTFAERVTQDVVHVTS